MLRRLNCCQPFEDGLGAQGDSSSGPCQRLCMFWDVMCMFCLGGRQEAINMFPSLEIPFSAKPQATVQRSLGMQVDRSA